VDRAQRAPLAVKVGPRAKAALLASLFLLPIVASLVAYRYTRAPPSANYGELLLPPRSAPAHDFVARDGAAFSFERLRGQWVLIASDSGACAPACRQKLYAMRQVRLALGRNATRLARVLVVDDVSEPGPELASADPGVELVRTPRGLAIPAGAANDRAHIYLADPHGNVMMRWPSDPDLRRMFQDLDRLLKASQIG
jgi:hypothetical protein